MIELDSITQRFNGPRGPIEVLRNLSLTIPAGSIFGIIGRSGAGKSTLLRTINLLTRPTSGRVLVDGRDLTVLNASALRAVRREIGMIFQHFNLLSSRTVQGNVALPLELVGMPRAQIEAIVLPLLELVGLSAYKDRYPNQLSGGQKQRVGIARALASRPQPRVLLSDEATSALDPETTRSTLNLLQRINRELKLTIVLVTHQIEAIKAICDSVAVIDAGRIIEQRKVTELFLKPRHSITRSLLGETLAHELPPTLKERVRARLHRGRDEGHERLLRLAFTSASVERPLLSETIRRYELDFNILHGRIDEIQGHPFGSLAVLVGGATDKISQAIDFLTEHGVVVEEMPDE